MNFRKKTLSFFRLVFPVNLTELGILLFFLLCYGIMATYIALNFRIVFDNRIPWDAYFSFDNRSIILTGGGYERHPLSNYFFEALRNLALWISGGKMNEIFRVVLAICSCITVSFANLQLYKYLKNIIQLPKFISVFLVFFFGLFATPILLSFTPETYTYSLFFLLLYQYYVGIKFKENKKISGVALTLSGVAIGGLTVTNISKVYLPLFFENQIFKSWKKIGNAFLRVLISAVVFALLVLNRINFDYERIFNKAGEQYEKFSQAKIVPVWDMVVSWFFGGNILFSEFALRDYHNQAKTFYYKALFMDPYSSIFNYIFVGIIYAFVFWSYFKNFKNKWVQVLMLSFFVDITIHCILKFGLHTSYIYGGHFIFVVPMMLGWLFFAYRNQPKTLSFLMSVLVICFLYLGMNNLFRLQEFFQFLNLYYR